MRCIVINVWSLDNTKNTEVTTFHVKANMLSKTYFNESKYGFSKYQQICVFFI